MNANDFLLRSAVLVTGVLLCSSALAIDQLTTNVAKEIKPLTGKAQNLERVADEAIASSVAVAVSEFAAAVQRWALVKATEVPWNQPNSTTPINYRPVFLWAAGSASGYVGSATDCRFPSGGGGVAVPGVSGPIKLSGQSFTINTSSSKQAQAIKNALMNAGSLLSNGSYQLLPANFGSTWDGVFCASVKFNAPVPKRAQIVTWFVPARVGNRLAINAASTDELLVMDVGRKVSQRAASIQPEVGVVLRKNAHSVVPW